MKMKILEELADKLDITKISLMRIFCRKKSKYSKAILKSIIREKICTS